MKTKDQVQKEAIDAIKTNRGRGLLFMATGTGKSKVAIDYAKEKKEKNLSLKILLVVPTVKLRDENWKDEFYKWNAHELWENNVETSCYASISKIEGNTYDFVILDEVHNITLNNYKFFEQNEVKDCVGLTATPPPEEIKQSLLLKQALTPIYTVTLDEAVQWGLVSPYKIIMVAGSLDSITRNIPAGSKSKPFYTTELKAYTYLTQQIDNIDVHLADAKAMARRQMLILKRLRFIYDLPTKTKIAKFLLDKVIPKEERTIIFAGSIVQAEALCENSYHSQSSNSDAYDAFKAERINRLSSVRSLNQGENINNLDNALLVQVNSKELDSVQRIGRVVRYRDEHLATIWIIYIKNTVDEIWLNKALADFDRNCMEYINYSLLKMNYNDDKSSNQTNL